MTLRPRPLKWSLRREDYDHLVCGHELVHLTTAAFSPALHESECTDAAVGQCSFGKGTFVLSFHSHANLFFRLHFFLRPCGHFPKVSMLGLFVVLRSRQ